MILLNKPIGKTPLQMLQALRESKPEYKKSKLAYAGRLDPLAEGLLLVLVDDECKQRDKYQALPKTYEFEVLFGFATDTFDLMGMVTDHGSIRRHGVTAPSGRKVASPSDNRITSPSSIELKEQVESYIKNLDNTFTQSYPPYSSYHVNGKPLFWYAKNNKLGEIELPTKTVSVNNKKLIEFGEIDSSKLMKKIKHDISKVTSGDFRQEKILEKWKELLTNENEGDFLTAKFEFSVESGFYVRSFANDLGKALGVPSLALSIKRTQIGEFNMNDGLNVID